MKDRLTRSIKGPAIIFGVVLALVVAFIALWNFVLVYDYVRLRDVLAREQEAYGGAFHWTFIAIGSSLLVAILVLLALMGTQLLTEIRFSQRQSSFIASVTHELNSPLSSIKLFAQTLQKQEIAPEERARFLGLLLADVERLRSLIANILRQAQIDRDRLILATESTPLREYLEDYVERRNAALKHEKEPPGGVAGVSPAGGHALVLLDGPDTDVEIDRTVFRQVLDNVVDNALKFGKPEGVRVEMQIRRAGPLSVALEVRDDGIGIAKTDLARIFGRFGRPDEKDPARARPGTGLGLSIVRAIVEAHEGKVEALSDGPGAGATIRVELPRAIGSTELIEPETQRASG